MGVKICPDCGGVVSDQRIDCPHCGHYFNPQKVNRLRVYVKRERSLVGCAIGCVISLDGVQVGSTGNGEQCVFYIQPGIHNITIGKGQNGPIGFNMSDVTKQIDVKPVGDLYINFVMKTKLVMGFYAEITSITQK